MDDVSVALVPRRVADSRLGSHAAAGPLHYALQPQREARRDALQVAADEHARQAAVEQRRVDALQLRSEVGAEVVLLEGELRGAGLAQRRRLDLHVGLERQALGEAGVEARGEGRVGVELRLAEKLRTSVSQPVSQSVSQVRRTGLG